MKSQQNRSDSLGRGMKIAAFLRFQNRSVFGTLRLCLDILDLFPSVKYLPELPRISLAFGSVNLPELVQFNCFRKAQASAGAHYDIAQFLKRLAVA